MPLHPISPHQPDLGGACGLREVEEREAWKGNSSRARSNPLRASRPKAALNGKGENLESYTVRGFDFFTGLERFITKMKSFLKLRAPEKN